MLQAAVCRWFRWRCSFCASIGEDFWSPSASPRATCSALPLVLPPASLAWAHARCSAARPLSPGAGRESRRAGADAPQKLGRAFKPGSGLQPEKMLNLAPLPMLHLPAPVTLAASSAALPMAGSLGPTASARRRTAAAVAEAGPTASCLSGTGRSIVFGARQNC